MLGIWLEGFDHEIELIGAVDFARDAVGLAGLQMEGFSEVVEPIDALRVAVKNIEDRARAVLRPLEQEEMVGGEVEHGKNQKREPKLPLSCQRR